MVVNLLGKALLLAGSVALLTACSNGGSLSLENPVAKATKGNPFVQINQGSKLQMVDTGTGATGITGWVTISTVSSQNATDTTSGNSISLKAPGVRHQ